MSTIAERCVVLIPSLEPDDRLPAYTQELLNSGFGRVIIVDDGSSEKTQPIFHSMEADDRVTVLHHDVNHGKGVALKTGYRWIMENCGDCLGIITADADGQHTVPDCLKLAEKLAEGKRALYLGSRDFSLPNVPERSRKGNRITSAVFKALYGQYLPDTQTGLRAFPAQDLGFMADVNGDRYEYEMKVLIACAQAKIPMIPVTIETVYENNNEGSHFHPIRDSYRIYKVILGNFVKFIGTSLAGWVVDQGFAALLGDWLLPLCGMTGAAAIDFVSGYSARVISAAFNYWLNRRFVFKGQKGQNGDKRSALRYAILAVLLITASNLLVWLLGLIGIPRWISKLVVDLVLYFVSYGAQQRWVFAPEEEKKA